MCYTGGPRCNSGAKKAILKAQDTFDRNPTEDNQKALKIAKTMELLTPEGIERLKKQDPEKAAFFEKRYDKILAGAKRYTEYRDNAKETLEDLELSKKLNQGNLQQVINKLNELQAHKAELNRLEGIHRLIPDTTEPDLTDRISKVQSLKDDLDKKSATFSTQIETVQKSMTENLNLRKKGKPVNYSEMMPAKFAGYFADTERKHFNAETEGSTFTELKNLNEVLSTATQQRGNLKGDDRDELIARGADPTSFAADKRYLMVKTRGKLGTVLASELPHDTMVTVVQKSEKAKPLCVTEVYYQKESSCATVVVADNPTLPGTESSPTLLITAFPGVSGPSGSNNNLLPYVGKQMTLEQAQKFYGDNDFTLNTVVKKQ